MLIFIKKYIAKKEEEQNKKIEKQRKQAVKDIALFKAKMFSKVCPVNKNKNCFKGCVHFKDGAVFHKPPTPDLTPDRIDYVLPRCKLSTTVS